MSRESKSDHKDEYFHSVEIRETILNCKVEGMQTTAKSLAKMEGHLSSIAQSLAAIAESLSTIERLKMIE